MRGYQPSSSSFSRLPRRLVADGLLSEEQAKEAQGKAQKAGKPLVTPAHLMAALGMILSLLQCVAENRRLEIAASGGHDRRRYVLLSSGGGVPARRDPANRAE